jgi:hypothetical protein
LSFGLLGLFTAAALVERRRSNGRQTRPDFARGAT